MKITFKKLFYLIAFLTFSLGAKAQYSAVPDTIRYSVGLDAAFPQANFAHTYTFGGGITFQVDVPLTEKFYAIANTGFDSFIPYKAGFTDNPSAIVGIKEPNINIIPLTVGLKYFLIRTFYLELDGGGEYLLNKSSLYANYDLGLLADGQMGILFKLHNHKYVDVGVRFEKMQNFYQSYGSNNFIGLRVAYAINTK